MLDQKLAVGTLLVLLAALSLPPVPVAAAERAPLVTYLETQGPSRFSWIRFDPRSQKREVLGTFNGRGARARLAWSADRKRALVTEGLPFGEDNLIMTEGRRPARLRVWEVTLASRKQQVFEFPEPARTIIQDVGYDREGRITALALQETPALTASSGTFIKFEGERYNVPTGAEGSPALAHAYRMTGPSRWSRIETRATTVNTHFAIGVRVLEAEKRLGTRSFALTGTAVDGTAVNDSRLLKELGNLYPDRTAGQNGVWAATPTAGGPVLIWHVFHEYIIPTGVMAFPTREHLVPAPQKNFSYVAPPRGYDPWACPQVRGKYLLVSTWRAGEHPRLYDVASRQLVLASDAASAAVFWP